MKNLLPQPLFTFSGTVSRQEYIITLLCSTTISLIYVVLLIAFIPQELHPLVNIIYFTLLTPLGFSLVVRRLRDLGLSLWWMASLPIPVVSLFMHFYLLLKKGNTQPS